MQKKQTQSHTDESNQLGIITSQLSNQGPVAPMEIPKGLQWPPPPPALPTWVTTTLAQLAVNATTTLPHGDTSVTQGTNARQTVTEVAQ